MTELQLIAKRQKYETSHILHLLLSVITAGFWVPVWVLVAVNNGIERGKIDSRLRKMDQPKEGRYMTDLESSILNQMMKDGHNNVQKSIDKLGKHPSDRRG